MTTITTDMTINFTKDLKILYAEDDLELQEETKIFFEILFSSVTIANDGLQALEKYKKESFDIVISDIRMPSMDGIELATKIREINHEQCIIIISAYSSSDYLLKFINLNIRQFIQKPIDVDNMLATLYYTSKSIVNEKMVEEYRASLEESNKELTLKNKELQSLVRILDSKLLQIAKTSGTQEPSVDSSEATISKEHLDELKELEVDIGGAAVLINLSKNLTASNIQVLGSLFLSYSQILSIYKPYSELSAKISELGVALNNAPENFIKRVTDISTLLESFIYVLRMWRAKVVHIEFSKAFELHSSMTNDISTIIAIVDGTQDEIETEMEFF